MVRDKIDAISIVQRLAAFVRGEKIGDDPVNLSPAQVSAAKILLDKSVPSLSSTELSGDLAVKGSFTVIKTGGGSA